MLASYLAGITFLAYSFGTVAPLQVGILFVATVFCVLQLNECEVRRIVAAASKFMAVLLGLSVFGVIYDLLGFQPLLSFTNPSGDTNYFYLFSLSNAKTFAIRPSAIYDEPGYLSLYICAVVCMREALGFGRLASAALLVAGLVTQSASHFVFSAVWGVHVLATLEKNRLRRVGKGPLLGLVVLVLGLAVILYAGIMDWAFERLLGWVEDPLTSPRVASFAEILAAIESGGRALLLGFDAECIGRTSDCSTLGGNPLVPLLFGGLLFSWPYYIFLITALLASVFAKGNRILAFGVFLILLGEPILIEYPYSALWALGLVAWKYRVSRLNLAILQNPKPLSATV
jgi:hypothetical protein